MNQKNMALLALLLAVCLNFTLAQTKNSWKLHPTMDSTPVSWQEGDIQMKAWMARDEIAIFPVRRAKRDAIQPVVFSVLPNAKILEQNGFVWILQTGESLSTEALLSKIHRMHGQENIRAVSPVFYQALNKDAYSRIVPTGELIVRYDDSLTEGEIFTLEKAYGLKRSKNFTFVKNGFLYDCGDAFQSIQDAKRLAGIHNVLYAYPNCLRKMSLKETVPNDTHYPDQWHLKNALGNLETVWDNYRGSANEVIAIVDNGLEILHEDLVDNIVSGKNWDYVDDDDDPTAGDHGTCVAGCAAAKGNNGQGVCGVAFDARLVGYRLVGSASDENVADAMKRNKDIVNISNNSWGLAGKGEILTHYGTEVDNALVDGITNGRNGRGIIYVWAAGNDAEIGENANYDRTRNSKYTIVVAASDSNGIHCSYSDKGANILVNAPSGGNGLLGIYTTDRTGADGYDSDNYFADFDGTSAAAPIVSGCVALILQANPNLTWRDVQHVIVESAYKNDAGDSEWTLNGAGKPINHKYGFGRINVDAAVQKALAWKNVDPQVCITRTASPGRAVPDNSSQGVSSDIKIESNLKIEHVEVYLTADDHPFWPDLEVELLSPSLTTSILAEKHSPPGAGASFNNWRFTSVRHWGEMSFGTWTLRVKDLAAQDTGTFKSWTIKIYGTVTQRPFDFDGDLVSDFCIWNKSNGEWRYLRSNESNSSEVVQRLGFTGSADYIPVPADYDYDGRMDLCVWHKTTGEWQCLKSSDGASVAKVLGNTGVKDWIPVPGDYDGDKKWDFAVWNKTTGEWRYIKSSDNSTASKTWGDTGVKDWIPVPGDYDGDKISDFCVWNKTTGNWYGLKSSDHTTFDIQWGTDGVNQWIPVPGDYDGDGITDLAIWNKSSGEWSCRKSSDPGNPIIKQWKKGGNLEWIPVPGDYDGDGITDLAVWNKTRGQWYCLKSSDGYCTYRIYGDQGVNRWIPAPQMQHVYLAMEATGTGKETNESD